MEHLGGGGPVVVVGLWFVGYDDCDDDTTDTRIIPGPSTVEKYYRMAAHRRRRISSTGHAHSLSAHPNRTVPHPTPPRTMALIVMSCDRVTGSCYERCVYVCSSVRERNTVRRLFKGVERDGTSERA